MFLFTSELPSIFLAPTARVDFLVSTVLTVIYPILKISIQKTKRPSYQTERSRTMRKRERIAVTVGGLFCKRPIQCLASSMYPRLRCGGGEDTLAGWRGGEGSIFLKTIGKVGILY